MNESQTPTYKKVITITSLSSKLISTRTGGKAFTPFNVYMIGGNDGITYETTMQDWYAQRKVGELVNISYTVDTTIGRDSKVYSHYKLYVPKSVKTDASLVQVMDALRKVYGRVEDMEKNILARLELAAVKPGQVFGPKDVPTIQIDEEEDPNISLDIAANEDEDLIEEEEETKQPELPF